MQQRNEMASRNVWSYFPWFIAAGMGAVIGVNCFMAYSALHTFPGNAGTDGFDLSNHYNAVIERVRQEASLGWAVQAETDEGGHPVILLADRSARPLAGAEIDAAVQRPLGDRHLQKVRFIETSPGQYHGDAVLDAKGQWELQIWVNASGQEFSTTRRIVMR